MDAAPIEFDSKLESSAEEDILPVLLPPQIARSLIREPERRKELLEKRSTLIDIATKENPAHSFMFATWNLPNDLKKAFHERVVAHFNQNPETGILLNLRGDLLKGFITSNSPAELARSLSELNKLMQKMKDETPLAKQQGFALLVAESAEQQVEITTLGKKDVKDPHFVMIPTSDAGLTYISWATSYLKDVKDPLDAGEIFWVTANRQEAARGQLKRDELVEGIEAERCTAHKSGTIFHLRPLGAKLASSQEPNFSLTRKTDEFWKPVLEDYRKLPEEDKKLIQSVAIAGFPGGALTTQEGPWINRKVTSEGVELLTEGQHVKLKFDFSGMSKMMKNDIDIGPYLTNVFSDLASMVDEDSDIPYYQAALEGDAMVMYLIMPGAGLKETMKHFLEVQDKLEQAFVKRLKEDLGKGVFKNVGEHEIGIKVYARISRDPITLKFLKGGVSEIDDPEFDKWETEVEGKAKKGGNVAGIVHDEKIDKKDVEELYAGIPHRTVMVSNPENPGEKIEVYLLKKETVYEQVYGQFIEGLTKEYPYIEKTLQEADQTLHQLTFHTTEETEEILGKFENNQITAAKILFVIKSLVDKNHLSMEEVNKVLLGTFSPRTCDAINTLWQTYEARGLPGAEKPNEPQAVLGLVDFFDAKITYHRR